MDITKSPYEFQAWWNAPEQAELRNNCAMGWGFRIWKAARESIEIEIPYASSAFDYNVDVNVLEVTEVIELLRTAGIRIKGDSE
ncbi:TPA: hypothetical protein ACMY33_001272 [Yersinia enterocolitica]